MALSVCFIFTVTIGMFPAVAVDVKSTVAGVSAWGGFFTSNHKTAAGCLGFSQMCLRRVNGGLLCSSAETYFVPVACFLLFNMMDWAGRSLTAVCMWVSNSSFTDLFVNKARLPVVFLEFFLAKVKLLMSSHPE